MTSRLDVGLVDRARRSLPDLLAEAVRRLPGLAYADTRLEVVEARSATAQNGRPLASAADAVCTAGVRVLAGDRTIAPGWVGLLVGAGDLPALEQRLREALERAYRRARANAEHKAAARDKLGPLGTSLADTRLHPLAAHQAVVPAVYRVDPRTVPLDDMVRFTSEVSGVVGAAAPRIAYNQVATLTQLSRELFASTEGALVDQTYALTEGLCVAVALGETTSQQLWDVMGHQRGWEILADGTDDDPRLTFPAFTTWASALAREAAELAAAPPAPTTDRDVVVVTDPHYNTLLAHEILGHPAELDRALKMETAYAGRSWLLGGLDAHHVGRRIASPLVNAYSDPALPGYGHYAYDHEGTPGRRVDHLRQGVFTGFMNSRQTAAVFGGEPNGHFKATDASLVPLVRMSTTVFAGGERAPQELIGEVDRGYYLVGHRIPSIAESRENFRISARRVYEIERGRLGRLFRDGGIAADTRSYLGQVDGVGNDFRLYPIPNCGKGQPMQSRRLGNGGPTLRSRARLTGGG